MSTLDEEERREYYRIDDTIALDFTPLSGANAQANEVLLDWDRKRPATSPMFSLTGLEFGNGGAAMSITTVPESAGGCSVAAERISVAPFNCQSIAAQELPGYRATRLLKTLTVYSDPKEGNSTVSLIDTPPGCLVIRRYVEFGWKPPR